MTDGNVAQGPQVQRRHLGASLRRLRLLAGLSGRDLARHLDIGQATVSRIENGQSVPSLPEVGAWADLVGASQEARRSLLTLTEAALNEVETRRARLKAGLPAMQEQVGDLEATAGTLRYFQPSIVPGLLQTAEYARRIFLLVDVLGDGDHATAAAARIERQDILYDSTKRFEFILTEAALRLRIGPPEAMAAQIDRITSVATLANVTIGVIPLEVDAQAIPWCGFNMYEDRGALQPFVTIETPHARITASDPHDVDIYRRQFEALRASAVYGNDLRPALRRIAVSTT